MRRAIQTNTEVSPAIWLHRPVQAKHAMWMTEEEGKILTFGVFVKNEFTNKQTS